MNLCKKCEGLNANFGWDGNVKVADNKGRILFGGAHDYFYADFYEGGDPAQWPVCPECKRSLGVYVEDPSDKKYAPWVTVLGVSIICLLVWGLLIWALFQVG